MPILAVPTPVQPGRFAASAEAETVAALIEAVVCDLHSNALMTAVTASAVNSLLERRPAPVPSYSANLPRAASLVQFSLMILRKASAGADAVEAVSSFVDALMTATVQLQRFVDDCALLDVRGAAAMHRYNLPPAWRQTAESAIRAIDAMEEERGAPASDLHTQNAAVLKGLLKQTIAGQSPCLDADGQPRLPALPQRRHTLRKMLLQQCRVVCRSGETHEAFARDISVGGVGLAHVPKLKDREPVTIELASGRLLQGTVAWTDGRAAGVQFDVPLSPHDPMLWA